MMWAFSGCDSKILFHAAAKFLMIHSGFWPSSCSSVPNREWTTASNDVKTGKRCSLLYGSLVVLYNLLQVLKIADILNHLMPHSDISECLSGSWRDFCSNHPFPLLKHSCGWLCVWCNLRCRVKRWGSLTPYHNFFGQTAIETLGDFSQIFDYWTLA